MTEAEWLNCADPRPMFEFLAGKASDRKLRLFAAWCFGHRGRDLSPAGRKLLATFRDRLDGAVSDGEWFEAFAGYDGRESFAYHLLSPDPFSAAGRSVGAYRPLAFLGEPPYAVDDSARHRCAVIRDLFGNPFRPVSLDPVWRTTVVLALAAGIYSDGAFDRLPILSDALLDAGCDSDEVVAHCRESGRGDGGELTGGSPHPMASHVRGCWVVDLVLGRA